MDANQQPRETAEEETQLPVPAKGLRLSRNDEKWDSLKGEIYRIYMVENNTLEYSIHEIEKYGFKASPRKWKMKLKEWKYEKHLSEEEMKIVVAKKKKRSDEGKNTVFYHHGHEVPESKIRNFERRKMINTENPPSPIPETPTAVTYCTPHPKGDDISGQDSDGETQNQTKVSQSTISSLLPRGAGLGDVEMEEADSALLPNSDQPSIQFLIDTLHCFTAIDTEAAELINFLLSCETLQLDPIGGGHISYSSDSVDSYKTHQLNPNEESHISYSGDSVDPSSISTMSYEYGVTCGSSDILGYSISEYMHH